MRLPLPTDEMMEESEDVLDLDDTHVANFLDVNYEMVDGDIGDGQFYEAMSKEYNELFDEMETQELLESIEQALEA